MNQERLWLELERVASRYRRLRYWSALAAAWLVAALVALYLHLWKAGLTGPLTGRAPPARPADRETG